MDFDRNFYCNYYKLGEFFPKFWFYKEFFLYIVLLNIQFDAMIKLDEIDIKLLMLLQDDAKMNIKDIADRLGMTKTPIYERIRRMEKDGVIEKYVARISTETMEHTMVVFCSVSLESQKLEAIRQFSDEISCLPEVLECYLMGGANDFLLKVVVQDLKAYHQFSAGKLAALPNVGQIKSTFVLHEIKRSSVFPITF